MRARHFIVLGLLVAAMIAGAGVLALLAARPRASSTPPRSRLESIGAEVLHEYPDLERRFGSMSYQEGFAEGSRLTQSGLARLSDAEVLDYAARRLALLSTSDATCVALSGGGDPNDAIRAMGAMSDDDLRAWIRLSTHAQDLELRGGPRPMSAEQASAQTQAGLTRIESMLTPADASRWHEARRGLTPVDGCFVERTALSAIVRMPPADATAFERAMLENAAQP